MNAPMTLECEIDFHRSGKGARKKIDVSSVRTKPAFSDRLPRVAKLAALALKLDRLVRDAVVEEFAELARLAHVTRARISQVMSLLNLAPDIYEGILFLPLVERGKDPIVLRDILPIAREIDWQRQRRWWATCASIAGWTGEVPPR